MSGFLALAKLAFTGPRLTMLAGVNTIAARAYATKKIYVAGIPWRSTDEEIKDFLSQHGSFSDFHFPKDDQGSTKGYGFLEFEEEDAETFIEKVNGADFKGRTLVVQHANPPQDRRGRRDDDDRGNRRDGDGRGYRRDGPRRGGFNNDNRGRRRDDGQYFGRSEGNSGERSFRRGGEDGERGSRGGYDRE
ncbi:hypothetical protein BGZ65_009615 [Modicella reniformis]|uniref:RRM domain-containing protein n=1 Tax=Modicella reniformis TaxID=1440133 RepID=A0A9P6J6T0_9FUNG|nr:hypothetical protein BGZ65_009615 [Modicella reniformis]